MRVAIAALLLCACFDHPQPDVVVRGVGVYWGSREYDELAQYVDECGDFLGVESFQGWVLMRPQPVVDHLCWMHGPVAGCTATPGPQHVVAERDTLRQTALCHEMAHTHHPEADGAHRNDFWRRLREAGF